MSAFTCWICREPGDGTASVVCPARCACTPARDARVHATCSRTLVSSLLARPESGRPAAFDGTRFYSYHTHSACGGTQTLDLGPVPPAGAFYRWLADRAAASTLLDADLSDAPLLLGTAALLLLFAVAALRPLGVLGAAICLLLPQPVDIDVRAKAIVASLVAMLLGRTPPGLCAPLACLLAAVWHRHLYAAFLRARAGRDY